MISFPSLRFEPPPVYFMRIPKTAGTSVRLFLQSAYPAQQIQRLDQPHLHQIESTKLRNYRCFCSHVGPALLPFIQQEGLVCMTFLRDPVEQTISHLYHRQARLVSEPHYFQPAYLAQRQPFLNADLRTWLDQADKELVDNCQTRHLGRIYDLRPYFKDGEIGRLGQPLLRPVRFPTLTDDHDIKQVAERAHQQLASMAVVGITERFSESIELVCDLLGLPQPKRLPEKNIGYRKTAVRTDSYRATTPPDLIERIETALQYDRALYAHACELFAAQLARYRARSRRTISIAPRLRNPVQRVRQAVGQVKYKLLTELKPIRPRQMP